MKTRGENKTSSNALDSSMTSPDKLSKLTHTHLVHTQSWTHLSFQLPQSGARVDRSVRTLTQLV